MGQQGAADGGRDASGAGAVGLPRGSQPTWRCSSAVSWQASGLTSRMRRRNHRLHTHAMAAPPDFHGPVCGAPAPRLPALSATPNARRCAGPPIAGRWRGPPGSGACAGSDKRGGWGRSRRGPTAAPFHPARRSRFAPHRRQVTPTTPSSTIVAEPLMPPKRFGQLLKGLCISHSDSALFSGTYQSIPITGEQN